MKDILWLIKKTLRTTFRKKGNILLYLVAPIGAILIALLAYGGQTTDMKFGVINHDAGNMAEETIAFLGSIDHFKTVEISDNDVSKAVTSREMDGVITFQEGYTEGLLKGEPDAVHLTSIKGDQVTAFVKSYLYQYIDHLATLGMAADGNADLFNKMYEDYQQSEFQLTTTTLTDASTNKNLTISAIGFLIMIMMMSAATLSEIILAEKENRTYFRLLSTPITARKYIISNIIVNMIVMFIQVTITLMLLTYVFHIDLNIPFGKAFIVMAIFSVISVGVSLVLVAFSNSRGAFSALMNLVIMPTVMLSGCFWPVEVMPEVVQKISKFLPQRWTLDTLEALQAGSTFSSLYLNLCILFAFAIAFFLIAIYKFSRNNDTKSFI
ncbi:ABC transporter permease [Ornithinibacillus gellani]|uniref:ABC transporter permease n=1 Tax=Ornithinibacillus gellani TaxID=2293253 RepID=UPI000F4614FD|nr:ABC transporter permease [Ornithinibacillus gellani]TQS75206.1 ABC transporter permease [Ornithinibacillus gellani]